MVHSWPWWKNLQDSRAIATEVTLRAFSFYSGSTAFELILERETLFSEEILALSLVGLIFSLPRHYAIIPESVKTNFDRSTLFYDPSTNVFHLPAECASPLSRISRKPGHDRISAPAHVNHPSETLAPGDPRWYQTTHTYIINYLGQAPNCRWLQSFTEGGHQSRWVDVVLFSGGQSQVYHLFYVSDKHTTARFLADTGIQVSISTIGRFRPWSKLILPLAANGTSISVHGKIHQS